MKRCYIVGAADFAPARFRPEPDDLIIAADAGILHLERLGVKPDLILGDFDSLGHVPEFPDVEVSPVRKDDTDSMLAARRAIERGCDTLLFFGCLGGRRLDHTLANIQTIAWAANEGAAAYLVGDGCAKCRRLEANTREALKQLGVDAAVEHVTDFAEIAAYGVLTTPALVVDGKTVSCGVVLSVPEAVSALKKCGYQNER